MLIIKCLTNVVDDGLNKLIYPDKLESLPVLSAGAKNCFDVPCAKSKEVKTEPKPYVAKRKLAYPQIGDQLDMLWHSIDESPELKQKYFKY